MKKIISVFTAVMLLLGALTPGISASTAHAADTIDVYVAISDAEGKLAVSYEKITVSDRNDDGIFDIDEVLYSAHEAKYEGGAAAGYASANSTWGLSINKLWGVANGGSYGYYVNNGMAMGLSDEVKDGDHVYAYIYTDTTTFSDTYCWFDISEKTVNVGDEITLTLTYNSYDPVTYAPSTVALANANITVNGEATSYKTDADGKVTVKLDSAGLTLISATSESMNLVSPICNVTVNNNDIADDDSNNAANDNNTTADDNNATIIIVSVVNAVVVVAALAAVAIIIKKKKTK